MEGGWWWLSQLSRFGVARSCTHSLELLKRLRKGTGLCFSVYHACRVSMYAPTTSPYGPPASLPPLPGAPPPMVSQPVYDYAPMVSQPVYDYAPMETAAVGSAKKLKAVAGVLGLLSILLLAATITLGILYGTKGGETTVTVAPTTGPPSGTNPCSGADPGFSSIDCFDSSGNVQALEQAGANVTSGYQGSFNASGRTPITTPLYAAGLCPVNVHWHLGTEHYSAGQYDETGSGPSTTVSSEQMGYQCTSYDSTDSKFTTAYNWQNCVNMQVGQTYEVHWPSSAAGACGTLNQYQTPFADGVFCNWATVGNTTYEQIGVQAQVFIVVNDESYYYPNLIRGMIVDATSGHGSDMALYTGSTTGSSKSNTVCSQYAPITWQVDRKCWPISASSFDKMCADMKAERDDMSSDLYPHGSRVVVADALAANNQVSADFTTYP